MDTGRFDLITVIITESRTRRGMLRMLGAAVLGIGGLSIVASEEGDAKRRRKRRKKGNGEGSGKDRCLRPGDFCDSDSQCCSSSTKYICAVSSYASNSDKTCCGGVGAVCGPRNEDGDYLPPHCCAGFECFYNTGSTTGVCQKLSDDI